LPNFEGFLLAAPVLLLSMVAHEYAHGYAALKQGDPTAQQLGRLTWNPLKHIDPFLTILLPLLTWYGSSGGFIFGGAKPVPVVPRNYRNYRRGDIIVSLAGIFVNMLLFGLCTALILVFGLVGRGAAPASETMAILQLMMFYGVIFNLVLAVFNLLPIPPLDGSHVFKYLLPPAWALRYQQVGRFGMIILLVLIATRVGRPVFEFWMTPVEVLARSSCDLVRPFVLASPLGVRFC
jgi:Zn-dependent protease